MHWIVFSLLAPALYAGSNIVDEHLSNHLFKKTGSLIFYTSLTNLLFLPIVFVLSPPSMISWQQVPFFVLLGLTGVGYLYPYYKALQKGETSVVVSLFSLEHVFVPILAYFMVGERLTLTQYTGVGIIFLSALLISLKRIKDFKFNASFYWMSLCSLILSVEIVVYKYIFNTVSWGTGLSWGTIFTFLIALLLLLPLEKRRSILSAKEVFKKNFKLFSLEEFFTFAGTGASTFALSLAPATLVKAVGAFQPIFVLFYIFILKKITPKLFKESFQWEDMAKKIPVFSLMALGIFLIF